MQKFRYIKIFKILYVALLSFTLIVKKIILIYQLIHRYIECVHYTTLIYIKGVHNATFSNVMFSVFCLKSHFSSWCYFTYANRIEVVFKTRVVRRQQNSPRGNQIEKATFSECHSKFKDKVKNYGMVWKVLSRGIHVWSMKALYLTVHKLWPRWKFWKSRSNFKVKVTRSKIMKWHERSCHKECTYAISKP